MKFTDGYVANPVCSPTRYSIMTAKYRSRVDATGWFTGKREGRFHPAPLNNRMPLEEVTLARALREQRYATFFAGAWHLGPTEQYWPENRGFDINKGGWSSGSRTAAFTCTTWPTALANATTWPKNCPARSGPCASVCTPGTPRSTRSSSSRSRTAPTHGARETLGG
ncbi:MAG: sulfatase-like hydrolase/transferase, partial [Pirellulaceae bacterium]